MEPTPTPFEQALKAAVDALYAAEAERERANLERIAALRAAECALFAERLRVGFNILVTVPGTQMVEHGIVFRLDYWAPQNSPCRPDHAWQVETRRAHYHIRAAIPGRAAEWTVATVDALAAKLVEERLDFADGAVVLPR